MRCRSQQQTSEELDDVMRLDTEPLILVRKISRVTVFFYSQKIYSTIFWRVFLSPLHSDTHMDIILGMRTSRDAGRHLKNSHDGYYHFKRCPHRPQGNITIPEITFAI